MTEAPSLSRRASFILYMGTALLAFFPVLFLGKAFFANDLLHQFGPFRQFLREELLAGRFPLWNPYLLGGQPFFANPNSMMAYPVNYLTLLFPVPHGMGVFLALHMALAAAGMHFWLKGLKLSEGACRVGALLFALSGLFWWEIIHLSIFAAYAWFPWLMGTLDRWTRTLRPTLAFLAGLLFALILSCGNFQATLWIFATAVTYAVFRLLTPDPASPEAPRGKTAWKRLPFALLFAAWGALPLLIHAIPAEEFSRLSNRRDPSQTYENFQGTFSMRPSSIYEFLFPAAGVPKGDSLERAIQVISDPKNVDNAFLGAFGYLGVWLPFLAWFAFARKDRRFQWFLLAFALFSLAVAWGRYFPLHRILCNVMPGMDLNRAPFRFIQGYVLFACVLAAYGFQALERWCAENASRKGFLLGAGTYAALLLVVAFANPAGTWCEILGLLLGTGGLFLWASKPAWKVLGGLLFQAGIVLPLLLAGWAFGFGLGPASNFDFEGNFPAFSRLREVSKEGRVYLDAGLQYPLRRGNSFEAGPLPGNSAVGVGIPISNGYSPIVLKTMGTVQSSPLPTYVRLMALQGLLLGKDPGEAPAFEKERLANFILMRPKDPVALVSVPRSIQVMETESLRLSLLRSQDFDPRETAILSVPFPAGSQWKLSQEKAAFTWDREVNEPDRQAFRIDLDRDGLAVLSEPDFPGWKAWVDGEPAVVHTANHAFRSVLVPEGKHRVEFAYEPAWGRPLLWLLLLWTLSAGGYAAILFRRSRATG